MWKESARELNPLHVRLTYNVITQRGVVPEHLEFIQKPFSLNDLTTKVRAVLDKQVTCDD